LAGAKQVLNKHPKNLEKAYLVEYICFVIGSRHPLKEKAKDYGVELVTK
jgi:hypothetical protein